MVIRARVHSHRMRALTQRHSGPRDARRARL